MIQRAIPKNMVANYRGLIDSRRGTGPLKDLPFGCSVSFRGRNFLVGGFDEEESGIRVRLVDRMLKVELLDVDPADLVKNTQSAWAPAGAAPRNDLG